MIIAGVIFIVLLMWGIALIVKITKKDVLKGRQDKSQIDFWILILVYATLSYMLETLPDLKQWGTVLAPWFTTPLRTGVRMSGLAGFGLIIYICALLKILIKKRN